MVMGTAGCFADVMTWDAAKSICIESICAIEAALEKYGVSRDNLFQWLSAHDDDAIEPEGDYDWQEAQDDLRKLVNDFCESFKACTTVDGSYLKLTFCYHDPDTGDKYDDVQGSYFDVSYAYYLSPAGEKFKDKFDRKFFTQYG